MIQSAAIKQGRSANRKHTYIFFFFFCLSGSYNISSQIKISNLFNTVIIRLSLTMTGGCVRQLICSAHDRISEKVNLKVCCFESSKQKIIFFSKSTFSKNSFRPIPSETLRVK